MIPVVWASINPQGVAVRDTDQTGQRVRLWGMDAPELGAMCRRGEHTYDGGAAARDALAGLVGGRSVGRSNARRLDRSAAITA